MKSSWVPNIYTKSKNMEYWAIFKDFNKFSHGFHDTTYTCFV